MNFLFYILFSVFSAPEQDIPGIYQIVVTGRGEFSSIEIKKDGSFIFKHRGTSCLTWQDIPGFWETKEDTLILKSYHPFLGEEVAIDEAIIPDNGEVTANFKTAHGLPISEMLVRYWGEGLQEQIGKTDASGTIRFKKEKKSKGRAFLLFDVINAGNNHGAFAFTFLKYNFINVCVNLFPKEYETFERQEKFIIRGDELLAFETNSYYEATFKRQNGLPFIR